MNAYLDEYGRLRESRYCKLKHEHETNRHAVSHSLIINRGSADRCESDKFRSVPWKVFGPNILARVEQRLKAVGRGVVTRHVGPLKVLHGRQLQARFAGAVAPECF